MPKRNFQSGGGGKKGFSGFPVSQFVALSDAPHNYTGAASKFVTVKAGEDGLEFIPLPPLAITDTFIVNSQAAMLALTAQRGDVSIRTDINQSFILAADDPTILANWAMLLVSPTHDIGGPLHNADTIPNIQSKVTGGSLITSAAFEIAAITAKAAPQATDFLLIEDHSDGDKKKKITIGTLPAAAPATHAFGGALHSADTMANLKSKISAPDILITSQAAEISTLNEKTNPLGNDIVIIEDLADTNKKKKVQISNLQFPRYIFFADQLLFPNNSDWTVNNPAPVDVDTLNAALVIRRFDDSTEEGTGFSCEIPINATGIILHIRGRAITAPGTAKQVILRLYTRQIADNATPEAWSGATTLTAIDIPTNAYFQFDSQTLTLAALGLTAGRIVNFELTRRGQDGNDTLTGDYGLLSLKVNFF